MNKKRRVPELSTTQIIAVGFLLAIVVGTLLLCLPFAAANGKPSAFMDALFTATTSVCVTGLTTVDIFSHYSLAGQIIVLFLIQIGGLGIVSLTTAVMMIIGRKVTLRDRLLLESALNLNTLSGLVKFLRRVLKWTFIVEGIGAACYCFTFIPRFGFWSGLWKSVFLAVSAFCNAGMDVLGPDSLFLYRGDVWINLITMALIVMGGLGFIVWWDVARVAHLAAEHDIRPARMFQRLHLHSKLALIMTAGLILVGALLTLAFEFTNPATLGALPFGEKVLASLFQSVTLRTAGFATISQKALRDPTALLGIILMFIGGSPVGTAGGIKTTTFAMVFISAASVAHGKEDATLFRRTLPVQSLRKAVSVATISLCTLLAMTALLSAVTGGEFLDVAFETASAIGTVGLTRDFSRSMNVVGKLLVVLCMYLGRIGPVSLAIAFNFKKPSHSLAVYPKEEITVG